MRTFCCPNCEATLYFENDRCLRCQEPVAFDPATLAMTSAAGPGSLCGNGVEFGVCNWLAPEPGQRCLACTPNESVPDLSVAGNLSRWSSIEAAKRRLAYSLIELGLAAWWLPRSEVVPLRFRFHASTGGEPVVTGHDDGVITLDIAEAVEAERAARRAALGEDYRTLLGHLRHEIAHYYWLVLVDHAGRHDEFRAVFGDERADYPGALASHYQQGAPPGWEQRHITEYASSHPHEDWAETFAHYLHIHDTLETARHLGIAPHALDDAADFGEALAAWSTLSVQLNMLSRSMGYRDMYPFSIVSPVAEKLHVVHRWVGAPAGG